MKKLPLFRTCGPCEACCTVLSVEEIGKGADTVCPHQLSDLGTQVRQVATGSLPAASGCAIYKTRPGGCRTFMCLWLAEGSPRLTKYARHRKAPNLFRANERPDLSGLIFHPPAKVPESALARNGWPGAAVAIVREVWPGAAEEDRGASLLARLTRDRVVMLVRGDRRTLLGPAEQVEAIRAELEGKRGTDET